MVGVAGKSKACHNCKARRVKCDLGQPQCARCAKAGLNCLGYQLKQIYVNRTHTNPSVTAQDVITGNKRPRIQEEPIVADVVLGYLSLVRMLDTKIYSTTEFRAVACRILHRLYLPEERYVDQSLMLGQLSWVDTACGLAQPSVVLDRSLLAFCAAQMYATQHGGVTLYGALELYNNSLAELYNALQPVDPTDIIAVLSSIVVVTTCELFLYPSNTGWVAHVHGIAEILRLQNHYSHLVCDSPDWLRLCARARVLSALMDLIQPRRGRLTASQWRDVMFAKSAGDYLNQLLDTVSTLPNHFEWATVSTESVVEMIKVLEKMRIWEEHFRMKSRLDPLLFIDSQMHNPADDHYPTKLFPTVLEFPSLSFASCIIVCWGVRLQTLSMCMRLCESPVFVPDNSPAFHAVRNFLGSDASEEDTIAEALKAEADRWARLSCQCVEFLHRIEMGTIGPQSMTYSKWVLRNYFRQTQMTRELAWCENISRMTGNHGTHRVIQLMDFQARDVLTDE